MENEIKTKFNVGDKVWVLYKDKDNWEIIGLEIEYIHIEKTIFYGFYDIDDIYSNIPCQWEEQDCFATQAEAQAECDKRNKG